jgi:TRAP-type C4-dicarboxylate transport system permease small subunit
MTDDQLAKSPATHVPIGESGDLTSGELEALDPHGPGKIAAPPWPQQPADWIKKGLAYQWLDYGIYQLERVLVITSLLMMALMMSLYTLYNNVIDSNKLGVQVGALVLTALAGFTHTSLKGKGVGHRVALAAAAAAALAAFSWLVKTQHSQVIYFLILGLALVIPGAQWIKTPSDQLALKAERRGVFLGIAALSPLLAFIFTSFPRDFAVAEEYSKLLMFWVGFIGGSMATYHRAHLKIDFVRKLLKGRAAHIHGVFSLLFTAAITFVLFILAYDYIFGAKGSFHHDQTKGNIPDWVKTFSLTVSLGIMSMRFIGHAVAELAAAIRGPQPLTTTEATR